MAGIRIQHPTARNATFTVVDGRRPYRSAIVCHASIVVDGEIRPCARTHVQKTYHLNLDDAGATIVSTTIWERIRRHLSRAGFRLANVVEAPPAQTVSVPALRILTRPIAPGV